MIYFIRLLQPRYKPEDPYEPWDRLLIGTEVSLPRFFDTPRSLQFSTGSGQTFGPTYLQREQRLERQQRTLGEWFWGMPRQMEGAAIGAHKVYCRFEYLKYKEHVYWCGDDLLDFIDESTVLWTGEHSGALGLPTPKPPAESSTKVFTGLSARLRRSG